MTQMVRRVLMIVVAWGLFASGSSTATAATTAQGDRETDGRRGEVYLAMSGDTWTGWAGASVHRGKFAPPGSRKRPLRMPRKVSLVQVMDGRGQVVATRPAPFSSGEVVLETLKRELGKAGYRVTVVRKLTGTARGIDVSFVAADLRQSSGLLADSGSCTLQVTLDSWQGGVKRESRRYSSTSSDRSAGSAAPFAEMVAAAAQQVAEQALSGM